MRTLVMAGAWVWGLVALLELTDAGVGCFSQVFLVLGGGAIALAWIGVSIAQPQVFDTPRVRWCWCAVPAIGLLALVQIPAVCCATRAGRGVSQPVYPELVANSKWRSRLHHGPVASALVLAVTNVGLMVRVWLSEAELRGFAERVIADPDQGTPPPRRIGLLTVNRVWADERQVRIYTAPSGFLDCAGVVYCPDGDEPRSPGWHSHLFGPWWWFWERF